MNSGLYTGAVIAAAERAWSDEQKEPTYRLMERAAEAALNWIRQQVDPRHKVVVFCGRGNNGGDGRLLAAKLSALGQPVQVWAAGDPRPGSDAQRAQAELAASPVPVTKQLTELTTKSTFFVDAILGTGFSGVPGGLEREAIKFLQRQPSNRILALDCPSGLDASTGAASCAVTAGHTLTFIGCKIGLVTGAGPGLAGTVQLAELDVSISPDVAAAQILDFAKLKWPPRLASGHKGASGHVRVVGGRQGMMGAGLMTTEAALSCGAGLVTAHIHPSGFGPLMTRCPEAMTDEAPVPEALGARTVVAIGPGLGRDAQAARCWETMVQRFGNEANPWVVDADALWHLAQAPQRREAWVLTPHPGEAARLLGSTVSEVQDNRLAAAQALQSRFGGVVVLKGAGNIIVYEHSGSQESLVLPISLGAMATGGLGDVLTGIIAALLAQGLASAEAAKSGLAALLAAAEHLAEHQPVVRASQVLARLPRTLHELGFHAGTQHFAPP